MPFFLIVKSIILVASCTKRIINEENDNNFISSLHSKNRVKTTDFCFYELNPKSRNRKISQQEEVPYNTVKEERK